MIYYIGRFQSVCKIKFSSRNLKKKCRTRILIGILPLEEHFFANKCQLFYEKTNKNHLQHKNFLKFYVGCDFYNFSCSKVFS